MIDPSNATLDERPKALNAIGMDMPTNIDFGAMLDAMMLVICEGGNKE